MPKYSVEDVLAIIQSLSPEEKQRLISRLPTVLDSAVTAAGSSSQNRSMTVGGNFEVSGSGLSVDFSQQQAGGSLHAPKIVEQAPSAPAIKVLARELAALKAEIKRSSDLNPLQKKTAAAPINVLQEELQKSQPDKNLIDQAVASLKKGLTGVQSLAEPTMKVAALVAKAWTGL